MARSSSATSANPSAPASAAPIIELHGLTLRLAGGRTLFDNLTFTFADRRTGLVGRNGAGKSMLARAMAGLQEPDAGRADARGTVYYLPQRIDVDTGTTVADVAGLGTLFAAANRLAAGHGTPEDLALLDGRWTVAADFAAALADAGLPSLHGGVPAAGLSGGQLVRVALAGAFLSAADVLILDEPTNHLDRDGRNWLRRRLDAWSGGVIAISHDRALLDAMTAIVELDEHGLHAFGGNFTHYQAQRDAQAVAAQAALDHARTARQAALRQLRTQHDARQQRNARASRAARDENQAAILLGRRKAGAQASAGNAARQAAALRARLDDAVGSAAAGADTAALPALLLDDAAVPAGRTVIVCEGAVAPWPADALPLDLVLAGPVRVAIAGPNGCGKSTLLKMLAGDVAPRAGLCSACVPSAWLDQHAERLLPPEWNILQRLRQLDCPLADAVLRSRLALLGLDAARLATPAGALSGGERIKAALACALWQRSAARLLLLDEPGNHLDLPALRALEEALGAWPGAFAIVSHDDRLLAALRLTHVLRWHPAGWRLETCH
ncbi:ATP-binding cassette domain-containing protein [Pseudoduganella umbonata]|uniref:ABC-F family ATP-binding cassette domain-containing protein n=1 Tax=Pseudoduganella umbonata TaxID=864828 RepID=A0A4P8HNX7_9BURK|nr:ATP-binding cassette domain-containing protein [Pseudoduganella umbonata]MBB3220151.1 ATPase subunit of ABC transporter with duplicated ATPase domains [Pseudoduganella umbonata]QCP10140.1 ABC-F family ATP-binding cassette domain-containing protein [Pseudoduganella umbonata]